jgi:ketosteroid isomerase-like protein
MSQENVEMARRLYGFWQDRDYAAREPMVHPDLVVDLSRNIFNPAVFHGVDGFRQAVEQIDEMWDEFTVEPEEFTDLGDKVVVASKISGRGRGSGVTVEMPLFAVMEFREGKLSRMIGGLRDRAAALEAAGSPE